MNPLGTSSVPNSEYHNAKQTLQCARALLVHSPAQKRRCKALALRTHFFVNRPYETQTPTFATVLPFTEGFAIALIFYRLSPPVVLRANSSVTDVTFCFGTPQTIMESDEVGRSCVSHTKSRVFESAACESPLFCAFFYCRRQGFQANALPDHEFLIRPVGR